MNVNWYEINLNPSGVSIIAKYQLYNPSNVLWTHLYWEMNTRHSAMSWGKLFPILLLTHTESATNKFWNHHISYF